MAVGREPVHVRTDLGEEHLGGAAVDAGDGVQELNLVSERGDETIDLPERRPTASSM